MNMKGEVVSQWYSAMVKSRTVVVTGAGASVPLGMPAMEGFYNLLEGQLQDFATRLLSAFPNSNNDLEVLLSKVAYYEDLKEEARFDHVLRSCFTGELDSTVKKAQDLREHIFDKILTVYGMLSSDAQKKAAELYEYLFLRLHRSNLGSPLPIFTTNYDLTFEAIRRQCPNFSFCTGLDRSGDYGIWNPSVYKAEQDAALAVFRLHGCSHWIKDKKTNEIVFQARPNRKDLENIEPHILYPVPGKDGRTMEEPFQTGYEHLRVCLKNATRVLIIGYSGRDALIQQALREALNSDPDKRLIVVFGGQTPREELKPLLQLSKEAVPIGGGIEDNIERVSTAALAS